MPPQNWLGGRDMEQAGLTRVCQLKIGRDLSAKEVRSVEQEVPTPNKSPQPRAPLSGREVSRVGA